MDGVDVVWKYEIPIQDEFTIQIPRGSDILYVDVQRGKPCLWALVDPNERLTSYQFILMGTGHLIKTDLALTHRGSFRLCEGAVVFHLFEAGESPFC